MFVLSCTCIHVPCFLNDKTHPILGPGVIFEDDFNVSPTLKINPSWEIELPVSKNFAAILVTHDLLDIPEDDDMIALE